MNEHITRIRISFVETNRGIHSNPAYVYKKLCLHQHVLTLRPDQYEWNFGRVAVVCHFRVVAVHRVETRFVFQAEHEYNRVHPRGKL